MQAANKDRGGGSPNGGGDHSLANYQQKYPAQGHYIGGNKQKKANANRLSQFFILVATGFGVLCLSFIAVIIKEAGEQETAANGNIVDFDKQYPDIDDEVKQLAADLGLTETAKKVFYEYEPEIFETANHPDFLCNKDIQIDWRITVSGCWSASTGKIYLLADEKLRSTAAHEFLHAVYYDLYIADRHEIINSYLNETFNQNADELRPLISVYSDLRTDAGEFSSLNRYNELHSFIGTQIESISPELEAHYATYFTNRAAIVATYRANN